MTRTDRRRALWAGAALALLVGAVAYVATREPTSEPTTDAAATTRPGEHRETRAHTGAGSGPPVEPLEQVELAPDLLEGYSIDGGPTSTRRRPAAEREDVVVLTPAQLRERQLNQVTVIARRLRELDAQIDRASPDTRGLLEARRTRLRARHEQLRALTAASAE